MAVSGQFHPHNCFTLLKEHPIFSGQMAEWANSVAQYWLSSLSIIDTYQM
jgi:hypothetical protein